ncbi:helix-turn-helix domain-containing protein [Larkinella insperata]|uniref:Helix-turn-helix domain-containing protein n=1 Tax=Larkinella insperata TaxID=332158 RepID=A0ABW3QKN1_9BACT|nr:AraC family transcriptional regulator [Larkinella insperata]
MTAGRKIVQQQEIAPSWGGRLDTLVENKLTLTHEVAELNLYETFQRAQLVELEFNSPVLTSMLTGKKVMHIDNLKPFDYLPGESLVLPANKLMKIDFPEATVQTPTRCIALSISGEFIQQTVNHLNEEYPRSEPSELWEVDVNNYHFRNGFEISLLIDKIIRLYRENNAMKPFFIHNSIQELIVRLMQTQARRVLVDQAKQHMNTHRLAYVVEYIRKNLTKTLAIEELSSQACLSKSHFFRLFKNELGMSPIQFILQERIRLAKQILSNPAKSITDACFESGFNSLTHFSSAFRTLERISPRQYKQQLL